MISAVMPEGTLCSAQETSPLPPKSRKKPEIKASRHWCALGQTAPRSLRKVISITPAIAKRSAAMAKGGMDSTLTRMAK